MEKTQRPPAGIGHNSGAIGASGRRCAWAKARKDLVGARIPLEIVRIRVRRAAALGLSYPQYASVLLGSGRDIVGFLFTVGGLQLSLSRELSTPTHVREKLHDVPKTARLALSPADESPDDFRKELGDALSVRIDDADAEPLDPESWRQARAAIHTVLARNGLPADGVVMVGDSLQDASWADAAFLAKFIRTADYFSNGAQR